MRKEKVLDIRKDIATRKPRLPLRLGHFIYGTVMGIDILKRKPKFTIIDDARKCKGGCFVVFNHLSRLDHAYVLRATYPRRFCMVAGYSEFFRSHLHWVFKMQHIIPKKNYCNELQATRNMLEIVKKGGIVSFAPEGLATNDGQNKPVVPGTGKLFKHCRVPVYHLDLEGEYLQNTKVCLDERVGKTYATMKLLFTPEQLDVLTVEEIDNLLNEAFHKDEYAWQQQKHIKWKTYGRICENLHHLLFQCPKCGKLFTNIGKGDEIKCSNCGNGAQVDDYYDFYPFEDSIIPSNHTEWINMQRQNVIRSINEDPNFEFVEHVKVGTLPNDHYIKDLKCSELVTEGTLTINHKGVFFKADNGFDDKYDFNLNYNQVFTTFTEWDSSSMNMYVNNEFYEFFPEKPSVLYMNTLIEEMHRLHINYYKNFKWYDYMYEGMGLGIDNKVEE